MAIDNNLMNTQTGGEGETVQIQTQEKTTPEQFDVKITPQQPTTDSEQVTTTETVTEQPIEPPVQTEVTEQEVVSEEPSEFVETQQTFNEEPASTDSEYNPFFDQSRFVDIDENGNIVEQQSDFKMPEPPTEIVDNPFIDSYPGDDKRTGSFDSTLTNVSDEPYDPELDRILQFQKRNGLIEEPANKEKSEADKNSFFSPPQDDYELSSTSGLDVNPESLKQVGIDYDPTTATLTSDERKEIEKNIEDVQKEEIKQNALNEYYSVLEELQSTQESFDLAKQEKRKEDISGLRKQINALDKQLNSLSKNEYVKDELKASKKEAKYAHKKAFKGLCMNKNSPNYGSPGPCLPPAPESGKDYTYYPDKWVVKDPFDYRSNTIAKNVFGNRVEYDGNNQTSARYGDKITDNKEAINAVLQMFVKEGDIERYMAEEGLSREQAAAKHTNSIISQYNMKPNELMAIDKLLRGTVNWARTGDGVEGGKFKAALLPNWGILPPTTVTLDNGQKITLFKDIQENDDQKKRNKNGYGISSWNKDSFQYKTYDIKASENDPYFVPPKTLSYWEKYGMTTTDDQGNVVRAPGKFKRSTFNLQKRLLRALDENGEPYLKGDDPFFGVGLTGVMDDATASAQKRFLADKSKEDKKDTRIAEELQGSIFVNGQEYSVGKNNPFYTFAQTGKVPEIAYGKVRFKDTPFTTFKTVEEVERWANKNLSTYVKPISGIDTNLINESQEDFKDYIEGLGLGISVKLLGSTAFTGGDKDLYERATMFDMDRVLLKAPKGVMVSDLEIDLGEDSEQDKDRVAKLKSWLSGVQETPAQKYVYDWMAYNDPVNAFTKLSQREIARNNQALFYSFDKQGNPISVSFGKGFQGESIYAPNTKKLNVSEFTDFLQNEQNELAKKIEVLSQKSKQYNDAVTPDLQRLEAMKQSTREQQKKLASQLDLLEDDNKKGLIKDDAYYNQRKDELTNKITELQTNLNSAITNANKAVQNNKGLFDNITSTEAEVTQTMAQLKGVGEDIKSMYASAMEDSRATFEGPNTVLGSLVSSAVNGGAKGLTSIVDVMMDIEKSVGLISETKEETEERKMKLYQEWPDVLLGFFDLGKTEAYAQEEGMLTKTLGGAAESITSMYVNPITRVTKGTVLEKAGQIAGFGSVAYADINKELYSNPQLKDLPEYQKKLIALPYAIGMGVIEELGYGAIMKGNTSSFLGNVLTPVLNKALQKIPKNSSIEVIDKIIKSEVFANIGKITTATVKAAPREAEAELASTIGLEIGWKELSDNWLDLDAFNTGATWEKYLSMATEAYVMGGVAGGALGGTFNAVETFSNGNISEMSAKDLDAFRLTTSNELLKKQYLAYVANRQLTNEITKEQAENQILNIEKFSELNDKVSNEIEGDDRVKMIDLLMKKEALEEQAKKLDKSQAALPNPQLDQVNNDIKTIVDKTAETINKQQENVKENQTRVSSEVGEGQESIETQPVTETSQEEVSPGGVVQEEQTEVTPTEPEKITSVMTTGETQLESDLIGKDVSTGKQTTTSDIQTGETVSKFQESRNPTKGKVVNVEADPKNKNIERLILEDGTVLNRNKNTGSITLNTKVKASTVETEVKGKTVITNEFDELADINKITSPAKKNKAMKAFNEKYGEKAARISQIDSNFTSIVSKLEGKELIKKKC
jgi:hypothetical protein